MAARTLIDKPDRAKPGEIIRVRAMIGHAMESGFRVDAQGKVVPRKIIRRFTCHEAGATGETLVFAADFHPAVAANPYVAFHLVAPANSSTLKLRWTGDDGFEHTETVALMVGRGAHARRGARMVGAHAQHEACSRRRYGAHARGLRKRHTTS